ncbi:phage DNA packaging protein J [Salmonella enterica subsp. enterica]|nr:phage DNA packaging protein J [Salmonella enterica subsp. enterica]
MGFTQPRRGGKGRCRGTRLWTVFHRHELEQRKSGPEKASERLPADQRVWTGERHERGGGSHSA